MTAYEWTAWAVLTAVNVAAFFYCFRRFAGFEGSVIFKGRTYVVVEQSWDFDTDVLSIRAETR